MSSFVPPSRAKDGGIEAPMSLGGLFIDSDCDSDEDGGGGGGFDQEYSEQTVQLCEDSFIIRQYCWHMANANKVWPGTFTLAEFLASHRGRYDGGCAGGGGDMLELGAATGALALYVCTVFPDVRLCTSDIDDGGEVESNIKYNFERNGLACVPHVAHTWGHEWVQDAQHITSSLPPSSSSSSSSSLSSSSSSAAAAAGPYRFKYIIASDILLYVSAYPALVKTLKSIFLLGSSGTGSSSAHSTTRPRLGAITPEQISANIKRLFGVDSTLMAPCAVANKNNKNKNKEAGPPVVPEDDGDTVDTDDYTDENQTDDHTDEDQADGDISADLEGTFTCYSSSSSGGGSSSGGSGGCSNSSSSLSHLFEVEFLMSWQRRIAASETFFQMMRDEGFHVHHHGRCVYSFFLLYDTTCT